MKLNLAVDEIDDPIDGNPAVAVNPRHDLPVVVQAGIGDFDDERDVRRLGVAPGVVANASPGDREIGLGLPRAAGDSNRLLHAAGAGSKLPATKREQALALQIRAQSDREAL
jgi:hypothetical protein